MRDPEDLSLSGTWDDSGDVRPFLPKELRVIFIQESVRLFCVNWYQETYSFMVVPTWQADGVMSCEMIPTSPVVVTPAERWRRIGYRVFSRLSGGLVTKGGQR
jgi:hypothetical protein